MEAVNVSVSIIKSASARCNLRPKKNVATDSMKQMENCTIYYFGNNFLTPRRSF